MRDNTLHVSESLSSFPLHHTVAPEVITTDADAAESGTRCLR
jgi:hypothetical protein